MNYANFRKRRLITDILSPADEYGFNVTHPQVQRQPIGFLNRRYLGRFAGQPRSHSFAAPAGYFVPPLRIIHNDQPLAQINKMTASAQLLLFRAKLRLARIVGRASIKKAVAAGYLTSLFGAIRLPHLTFASAGYTLNKGRYGRQWDRQTTQALAAVPLLLLFAGVLWLVHPWSTAPSKSGARPQTTKVVRWGANKTAQAGAVSHNSSKSGSSATSSGNGGQAGGNNPNTASGSYTAVPAPAGYTYYPGSQSAPAVQGVSSAPVTTGGMGGGSVPVPTVSTTTPSVPSSSTLPLTLTVPSTDTSAGGKQILQTGSTPITIN